MAKDVKRPEGFGFLVAYSIVLVVSFCAITWNTIKRDDELFFKKAFGFSPDAVDDGTRPLLQPQVTLVLKEQLAKYRLQAAACAAMAVNGDLGPVQECVWANFHEGQNIQRAIRLASGRGFAVPVQAKTSGTDGNQGN
jgi:hypothetical protein